MLRVGMCKHFKGITEPCDKGHDILTMTGGVPEGRHMRIPCCKKPIDRMTPSQAFHWNSRISCVDYSDPTADEIRDSRGRN